MSFVTDTGTKCRLIPLKPIGEVKVAALPAIHALTSADNKVLWLARVNLHVGRHSKIEPKGD